MRNNLYGGRKARTNLSRVLSPTSNETRKIYMLPRYLPKNVHGVSVERFVEAVERARQLRALKAKKYLADKKNGFAT